MSPVKLNDTEERSIVRYRSSTSATRVQSAKSVPDTVFKRRYLIGPPILEVYDETIGFEDSEFDLIATTEGYDEELSLNDSISENVIPLEDIIEDHSDEFSINDDPNEIYTIRESYDEELSLADLSVDAPIISESHDEEISFSEGTSEDTSMPATITEDNDESLGIGETAEEGIVGLVTYEWDEQGVTVNSSDEITSWDDNVKGATLSPNENPLWDSTNNHAIISGWSENLETSDVDIDTDEFMVCMVLDWEVVGTFYTLLAIFADNEGNDETEEGGAEISSDDIRRGVPRYSAVKQGTDIEMNDYYLQSYPHWVVLCLHVKDGVGHSRAYNGINTTISDDDTVPVSSFNADTLKLNGTAGDTSGSNDNHTRAVRIWEDPGDETEMEDRIQQMYDDYIAPQWDDSGTIEATITLTDSFGDGWQGARVDISDSSGNVVFSGTVPTDNGNDHSSPIGYEFVIDWNFNDEEYTVDVTADEFSSEVSWEIEVDGSVVASGGDDETVTFNPAS